MDQMVEELGLTQSSFCNAHGLTEVRFNPRLISQSLQFTKIYKLKLGNAAIDRYQFIINAT